jgi:hypothetical protein
MESASLKPPAEDINGPFGKWLQAKGQPTIVNDMRKAAMKAVLDRLGRNRVSDCNEDERVAIVAALGIGAKQARPTAEASSEVLAARDMPIVSPVPVSDRVPVLRVVITEPVMVTLGDFSIQVEISQ